MTDNTTSLADWLIKIGANKEMNSLDLLSGITVNAVMQKVVSNHALQLNPSNTAVNRVNNWNAVMKQLEKIGIKVTQDDKTKIIQGNEKIVYGILSSLKQYHQNNRQEVEVDINNIDSRGDPKNAKSLLELFILVIVRHFGFNTKEAVALLSNDSKYLAHVLAKGFKDNYKPVQNMLNELIKLLPQIIQFCKNKENQNFFLKSIKPGLISKFELISSISLQLLTQYMKNANQKLQIVKNELMPTLVLCYRRHPTQLPPLLQNLLMILDWNKGILNLITSNTNVNQGMIFVLELINQADSTQKLKQLFDQSNFTEYVLDCVGNLNNSDLFSNAMTIILKICEINYGFFANHQEMFQKVIDNLNSLNLSKKSAICIYINQIFALLSIFGKKKNSLAPSVLKLAVEKYKNCLNEDDNQLFLLNFLEIIQAFPSIPSSAILQTILIKYEAQTGSISQLELYLFQRSIEEKADEKLSLKIYNIISKIFMQEVGSVDTIGNIIQSMLKAHANSKLIIDLTIKLVKICLAVYYANLRKLNFSKSLVEGTVKLDKANAFYKAKNLQIEVLLKQIIHLNIETLNKPIQPLVCYSFFQSELKNKVEAQGLREVMSIFGDQIQLRKKYQQEAMSLIQDKETSKKRINQAEQIPRYNQSMNRQNRVSSDASLLAKKKDVIKQGSSLLYLSSLSKVPALDAQKGLEKYQKVYLQKIAKLSIEQDKKMQEEDRKEELRKLFTAKMMEKGILIKKDQQVNCIFEFNTKQKQIQKDRANDFSFLPYYDPKSQEERDIKALEYLMKKHNKILKLYYNIYGGKLRPNTLKSFDEMVQKQNLMQAANAWKLLKDHTLDEFITVKQAQHVVQKINSLLKKPFTDSTFLDFEVFQQFIIHASLVMFNRPPKDMRGHPISDLVQEIFFRFKLYATENKIDERLFDDNQNNLYESEQIKALNLQLAKNVDYILPQGYKKITDKRLKFEHKIFLHSLDESFKQVSEVLDDILFEKLGFHIIQPYSTTITIAKARPLLYQTTQSLDSEVMKDRGITPNMKKEIIKFTGKDKQIVKEVAVTLADMLATIQFNRDRNKVLKDKKIREEELKKQEIQEAKKRDQRDRELKALLQQHKEKQRATQTEKEMQRKEEIRKAEDQKKKREKYEENLKKKVEEYMDKKKEEKNKEQEMNKKRKQEELRAAERHKQQAEKKKKLVEQVKKKKEEEEKAKIEREKQQKKKKQEEERKKMEQKQKEAKKLLEEYKQKKTTIKSQIKSK